jgi:hypothetical protein
MGDVDGRKAGEEMEGRPSRVSFSNTEIRIRPQDHRSEALTLPRVNDQDADEKDSTGC